MGCEGAGIAGPCSVRVCSACYPTIYNLSICLSVSLSFYIYGHDALAMTKPIAQPSGWNIAARPHSAGYLWLGVGVVGVGVGGREQPP